MAANMYRVGGKRSCWVKNVVPFCVCRSRLCLFAKGLSSFRFVLPLLFFKVVEDYSERMMMVMGIASSEMKRNTLVSGPRECFYY